MANWDIGKRLVIMFECMQVEERSLARAAAAAKQQPHDEVGLAVPIIPSTTTVVSCDVGVFTKFLAFDTVMGRPLVLSMGCR